MKDFVVILAVDLSCVTSPCDTGDNSLFRRLLGTVINLLDQVLLHHTTGLQVLLFYIPL